MNEQIFPGEQSARPIGGAVLVSGASFAGLATAYWMNRLGYRVTLIEVASRLRKVGLRWTSRGRQSAFLPVWG
jgi:2-polyprenyl-6-methoxyphenol hydroxylase-like FAD-dependent oxidoreductase